MTLNPEQPSAEPGHDTYPPPYGAQALSAAAYRLCMDYALDKLEEPQLVERTAFLTDIFTHPPKKDEVIGATNAIQDRPGVDIFCSNRRQSIWVIVPDAEVPERQPLLGIRGAVDQALQAVYKDHRSAVVTGQTILECARQDGRLPDVPYAAQLFRGILFKHPRVQPRQNSTLIISREVTFKSPDYLDVSLPLSRRLELLFEVHHGQLNVINESWVRTRLAARESRLEDIKAALNDSPFAPGYDQEYGLWEIVPPGMSRQPLDTMKEMAVLAASYIAKERQPSEVFDNIGFLNDELRLTYVRELSAGGVEEAMIGVFFTYLRANPEMRRLKAEFRRTRDPSVTARAVRDQAAPEQDSQA